MSYAFRIVTDDGAVHRTRPLSSVPQRVKAPGGAIVELIDEQGRRATPIMVELKNKCRWRHDFSDLD